MGVECSGDPDNCGANASNQERVVSADQESSTKQTKALKPTKDENKPTQPTPVRKEDPAVTEPQFSASMVEKHETLLPGPPKREHANTTANDMISEKGMRRNDSLHSLATTVAGEPDWEEALVLQQRMVLRLSSGAG